MAQLGVRQKDRSVFSQIIERWRAVIVGFVGLYSGVVKFRIRSAASHAELSLHARRRYTERLRYGGHGLAAQDALHDHCVFFRFPVYGFAFLARLFGGYAPADGRKFAPNGRKFAPKLFFEFFEFFEFHKKMPNQARQPTPLSVLPRTFLGLREIWFQGVTLQ